MRKREKSRITIETDEQLKVSFSPNSKRNNALWRWGQPKCILKFMNVYHGYVSDGSSGSRYASGPTRPQCKLDTNPTVCKLPYCHIIFAEKGLCLWKCESWFTDSMPQLFFKLTDPHNWEPLMIRDLVSYRKKEFAVVTLKCLTSVHIAQSIRFHSATSIQINPWRHMILSLPK